jgi:hypothetical protein
MVLLGRWKLAAAGNPGLWGPSAIACGIPGSLPVSVFLQNHSVAGFEPPESALMAGEQAG